MAEEEGNGASSSRPLRSRAELQEKANKRKSEAKDEVLLQRPIKRVSLTVKTHTHTHFLPSITYLFT